jgi:hypothetical protein
MWSNSHAVEHRFHAELLRIHAAFFFQHRITQKTCRYLLILRGARQQITG